MKTLILITIISLLTACGGEAARLAAQEFDGNTYQVEARPGPVVLKGMNEFLVIISNKNRQPVSDLIISLRIDDKNNWTQMIQDGQVGVYRRALKINDPQSDVLQVHVRKGKDPLTVLRFPLTK